MAMTLHDCPDFYVDNEGRFTNPTWVEWMVNKHKVYPSEAFYMKLRKKTPEKLGKQVLKL